MADYTVTTTEAEEISLRSVMLDPEEWITNNLKDRARIAGDTIVKDLIDHCNANGLEIPTGRDAQILRANELGLVYIVTGQGRPE